MFGLTEALQNILMMVEVFEYIFLKKYILKANEHRITNATSMKYLSLSGAYTALHKINNKHKGN